jgi:TRAP-type uncharacterized transport system substrate-binding protein
VKEVAAAVGPLRALPMDIRPDAVARMRAVLPGSYLMDVQPTAAFPEITMPMPMMAFDMALIAHADVPEAVVYNVVKTLHARSRELGETFAGLRRFRPDAMAVNYDGLIYHPGAIRFYREIGQWPPKEQ